MRIRLCAVGTRMPPWVNEGVAEYTKRMPRQLQVQVDEIQAAVRTSAASPAAARETEARQLLKRCEGADRVIALDEKGRPWTSLELADAMRDWQQSAPQVVMLVGGPDGLTDECRDRADRIWSLSPLTLPHGLVRVVLAEQLYRAFTIVQGHPYHRAS